MRKKTFIRKINQVIFRSDVRYFAVSLDLKSNVFKYNLQKKVIKLNIIILLFVECHCMHLLVRVNIYLNIIYQKIND